MLFYVLMIVIMNLLIEINLVNFKIIINYLFLVNIVSFLNFFKEIIKFGL